MPKICRYNRRPGGCRNINCRFSHPEDGGRGEDLEQRSLIPDEYAEKLTAGHKGCMINKGNAGVDLRAQLGHSQGTVHHPPPLPRHRGGPSRRRRQERRQIVHASVASDSASPIAPGSHEQVILIPDEYVGKLIGHKGCRINEVKAICTALIHVSGPDDIVHDVKRKISIRGSFDEIDEAKEALYCSLFDLGIEYSPLRTQREEYHDHSEAMTETEYFSEPSRNIGLDRNVIQESNSTITQLMAEVRDIKLSLELERGNIKLMEYDIEEKKSDLAMSKEKVKELEDKIKGRDQVYKNDTSRLLQEKEEYRKQLEYCKAELKETKEKHELSNVKLDELNNFINQFREERENLKEKYKSEILLKDKEIMEKNTSISDHKIKITVELDKLKHTIKELENNNTVKDARIDDLGKKISELQQENKSQMINKDAKQKQNEEFIKEMNKEMDILRLEKQKIETCLETQMTINENLKTEISEVKNKLYEAKHQANKEVIEQKLKNEKKIEQLQAEMVLNQKSLQQNFNEIKLRDMTINNLQLKLEKIKKHKKI